jgi:hypothetical protein
LHIPIDLHAGCFNDATGRIGYAWAYAIPRYERNFMQD